MTSSWLRPVSWVMVCGAALLFGSACGSSSSSGNSGTGSRTQTKSNNPADQIDGHASVLPSATQGSQSTCPADYKLCSDGGCCPGTGKCSDGFGCEVAPTACDTCASGTTSGRCCQGNCCPDGSTCNSDGLCSTKRVVATQACSDTVTTPCGANCCPAGSVCNGTSCEIHGGNRPVCDDGGPLCDNGYCCPVGYSCTDQTVSSYYCQKDPAPPQVTTTLGTCSTGESVILPKAPNCPAITADNSYYMKAQCCPTGSRLYCRSPSSTFDPEPTCLIAPTAMPVSGVCANGYQEAYSSSAGVYKCCPYIDSYPSISDIDGDGSDDCYYSSMYSPTCASGSVDPASGKCCSGTSSGSTCCPTGGSQCGTGCCDSGDYCSDGKCMQYNNYTSPTCPADAARRCSANDGSVVCCPLDTTCGPNGTCGCPLSAPVDCGSFCATTALECGCPADHPELCNGTCCLQGGCSRYGSSSIPDSCGCPSDSQSCGSGLCCPSGSTCGTSYGFDGCLKCGLGQTICGTNCCAPDEECSDGECVKCPASAPKVCGTTCCTNAESCVNGVCKASGGTGGGSSSGATCTQFTSICSCSYRTCITNSGSNCSARLETSSGETYECSSCSSCANAASSLSSSCCSSSTGASSP